MKFFECFACRKVLPITVESEPPQCPACKSTNGQVLDEDRVKEGLDSGAFFNIDPKTGKPLKKK
jgi:hypothetical protein